MKRTKSQILYAFCCITILIAPAHLGAQPSQSFILTLYGGLYFPSNDQFKAIYQTNSDIVWGFGVALPATATLFFTGDYSFFRPETFPYAVSDSSTKLNEKFLHLGLLSKQPLSKWMSLRLSGGFSYTSISQTTSGPASGDHTVDADKAIGYYGGIGIEQMLENGHFSFFADAIYDYRRSRQEGFSGDFGGIRTVLGVHLIMF